MRHLQQLLPVIEDAVSKRVSVRELDDMDAGELRGLVYQIVDAYRRKLASPEALFEAMIGAANGTLARFRGVKNEAIVVRAEVLTRLLDLASMSVRALGNPLRIKITRSPGNQQLYELDPFLFGVELAQNRKLSNEPDGSRSIHGRSWWVVMLAGEASCPDARWAVLDHTGTIDPDGSGVETIRPALIEPIELAEQLNERIVTQMLRTFSQRLRDVSDGQLQRMTEEDDRALRGLRSALVALEGISV